MKDDSSRWLTYAQENLESAAILVDSHLFNPCLQHIQQSVEKALKAVFIEHAFTLKKTHSIGALKNLLCEHGIDIDLSDEDCEFLDAIYLPSIYPLGSVLPHYEADRTICQQGISIAQDVFHMVKNLLET